MMIEPDNVVVPKGLEVDPLLQVDASFIIVFRMSQNPIRMVARSVLLRIPG